jgi:protein TonB
MFEDALMESGGRIKTKSKYYTIIGVIFNCSILAALILYPLLNPEALPKSMMATMLVAPAPPPPPPPPPPPAPPVKIIKVTNMANELTAPTKIPKVIKMTKDDAAPPPPTAGVSGMGDMGGAPGGAMGGILGGMGTGTAPVVKAAPPKKIAVSSGVMAGNLLTKTQPTYPAIAKAARIQGTVILAATISKSGTIENLRVVSGPPMLAPAAMDAVRSWRYKPYVLNGEPTEVDTQVTVNFTLGG